MGLSASQARFLQLTARKSNVEFQAQQINFQRLQWSDKLSQASSDYQDKTSNRKMVFSFNNGEGVAKVDVSYNNYKNYMNQQMDGLTTSQSKYYLVSSSGNKLVVASEAERDAMIEAHTTYAPLADGLSTGEVNNNPVTGEAENETPIETVEREDGQKYQVIRQFNPDDFLIVGDLDNTDMFQDAIKNGTYYFAQLEQSQETGKKELKTQGWEVLGGGAISEEYDTADDAAAEAEFRATEDKIQLIDKKLELQLEKLENERNAIQTELDSVSKVVDDNIESSFKVFS